MPKPRYVPPCEVRYCRDREGQVHPATEWIHINGRTLMACATCAYKAFGLPSPSTVARQRRREMERLQEVLPDA